MDSKIKSKEEKKELRKKYFELKRIEYLKNLEKEPFLSSFDYVTLIMKYGKGK
jgi:hypothetical protein